MKTALVAEDDPVARFLMAETLRDLGLQSDICGDGLDCVEWLAGAPSKYAAVFLDIHMPLVKGTEVVGLIRAILEDRNLATPVIAVSSDLVWHREGGWAEAGFDAAFDKPASGAVLREALVAFGVLDGAA